ncbi:hypothetical protein T484DRAFT_1878275 [Baffinella frigidus]|nr:hypothetical protein T484DRAFT_1878275 [Cryptophyta sp. CCMP2293]
MSGVVTDAQLAQRGSISGVVSDAQLVEMLEGISEQTRASSKLVDMLEGIASRPARPPRYN